MLIWEMPSKEILCIFCLDIGYFNTVRWPIFKFHCWKSKFYLAQFTLIFLYSQKLMPTKKLIYTPHLRDNLILIIFYQKTCTVWTFFYSYVTSKLLMGSLPKKIFPVKTLEFFASMFQSSWNMNPLSIDGSRRPHPS